MELSGAFGNTSLFWQSGADQHNTLLIMDVILPARAFVLLPEADCNRRWLEWN